MNFDFVPASDFGYLFYDVMLVFKRIFSYDVTYFGHTLNIGNIIAYCIIGSVVLGFVKKLAGEIL